MSYDVINTPFKIQGKKTKFIPFILETIEKSVHEFDTFVDVFCGSGVVGFNVLHNLPQFKKLYINDLNTSIINTYYDVITDYSRIATIKEDLSRFQTESEYNVSDYYYKMRDEYNKTSGHWGYDLINIARFLYINKMCFNGLMRFNKKGEFNASYCKEDKRMTTSLIEAICKQLEDISNICNGKEVDYYSLSFEDFIGMIEGHDTEKMLIYCDPPYIKRVTKYVNNDWGISDEKKLRDVLVETGQKFMVSNWLADSKGNINENVKNIWGDFKITYAPAHKYIIGPTGEERPQITEILITNF